MTPYFIQPMQCIKRSGCRQCAIVDNLSPLMTLDPILRCHVEIKRHISFFICSRFNMGVCLRVLCWGNGHSQFCCFFSPAWAKAKLGYSHHCHKSVCLCVCLAVHKVVLLRNYCTKSFQTWQADALGHPDVPLSKWSWSDWHCGHKSQIVKATCG